MKKRFYFLVLFLIAVDQLSKRWVEGNLPFHRSVEVLPFFSLYRTHNTGIAFSMFDWIGSWGLIAITSLVIAVLVYFWQKVPRSQQLTLLGFALVIAGALGNLADRVFLGFVVDFFLLHTQTWAFAVFNMADAFITVGAVAIIIDELFAKRPKEA